MRAEAEGRGSSPCGFAKVKPLRGGRYQPGGTGEGQRSRRCKHGIPVSGFRGRAAPGEQSPRDGLWQSVEKLKKPRCPHGPLTNPNIPTKHSGECGEVNEGRGETGRGKLGGNLVCRSETQNTSKTEKDGV